MILSIMQEEPASDLLLPKSLTRIIMLIGPIATVLILLHASGGAWLHIDQTSLALKVGLIAWSPLFFAIPALLLQDARDKLLPKLNGVLKSALRGVILVPYMLFSSKSTVRVEMFLNLVGLAMAFYLSKNHMFF